MLKSVGPYRLTRELRSDVLTSAHEGAKGKGDAEEKVTVVLGKMPVRLAPEDLELFKVEAAATEELGTEHVDRVLDHGMQHGMPYVVHPFVQSWSLGQQLAAQGQPRIDPAAVAVLGTDVARALAEAHAATPPLLHRGISVHSIVVDDLARARITGYGISAITTQAARKMPALATIALRDCAPELVEGASLGPATDLFALGAVLVTLLHGAMPAGGGAGLADKAGAELFEGVDVPAALSDTIARLLRRDSAERGRAEDVIDGLSGCYDDAHRARHLLADSLGIEATTLKGQKRAEGAEQPESPERGMPLDSVTKETKLPDPLAALAPARTERPPAMPTSPARALPAAASSKPMPIPLSELAEMTRTTTDFDDDPATLLQTSNPRDTDALDAVATSSREASEPALSEPKPSEHFFDGPTIVQRGGVVLNAAPATTPPTTPPVIERTEMLDTLDTQDDAIEPPTERTVQLSLADMPSRGEEPAHYVPPPVSAPAPGPASAPRLTVPEFGAPPNPLREWFEAQSKTMVGGWPLPWLVALGMAAVFFVVIAAVIGIVLAG